MITLVSLLVSAALLAPRAAAQDPGTAPGEVAAATPRDLVSGDATATTMWVQADAALRWRPEDAAVKVADAAEGDKVTLVLADGDWYRVLKGVHVGWVKAGEVSMVPPAGMTLSLPALGDGPAVDLSGLIGPRGPGKITLGGGE